MCALYSVFNMCQAFDEDFIYICLGDFVLSCSVVSDSLQPHELYSLPGSSVHGDSPRKNTEMCYHALLQETSQPRDQTKVPCIAGRFLPSEPPGKLLGTLGISITIPSCNMILKDDIDM